MEQRIVLQSDKKYIYFIQNNGEGFYLVIPRSAKVSLVLHLMDHVSDDQVKLLSDVTDKVIIIPVVMEQILQGVTQNNLECFQRLDTQLSNSLNLAHQILTYNHLSVDDTVYFHETRTYSMFHSWFLKKYQGRVLPIQLFSTMGIVFEEKEEPIPSTSLNSQAPVPEKSVPSQQNMVSNEYDTAELSEGKSFGFVSYVLLGVVVAVASLIFLYFLI